MKMEPLGKVLVVVGLGAVALGIVLWAVGKWLPNVRLGRLPGDIVVENPGSSFYFPITTMVLVSVVATIVMWIVGALRR